jgi:hypothetical protein
MDDEADLDVLADRAGEFRCRHDRRDVVTVYPHELIGSHVIAIRPD